MVCFLYEKGDGIIHGDSLHCWVPCFVEFAAAFARTMQERHGVVPQQSKLALLADCHRKETTTPGTGPEDDEPGAPCHVDANQL